MGRVLEILKRVKMGLKYLSGKTLLRENIVRMVLIVSLVYYLPGFSFFRDAGKKAAPVSAAAEANNGMGGGAFPEELPAQSETNLELAGVPEPEELSRPHMLTFSSYTMGKGDIIGNIAAKAGLNADTLISVNNIKNTRLMQIGQTIKIPNQDGIYYTVKKADTLESIAAQYDTSASRISTVNELFTDTLTPNVSLFIPGAKMDWMNRQEINGDLFTWPIKGYITSNYGYRLSPFDGKTREFHYGLDIGAPMGAPIKAAMAGRVSQVGYSDSLGNYVIITHHSGYRTLYGHMSVVRVAAGAYVETGQRIGDVGISGLTTGPHVHFTVYKNGVTVNPRSLMKP